MAITVDEYHGQGGSYLLNNKTGERKLMERTQPVATPQPEVTSDAAPVTQTPDPVED